MQWDGPLDGGGVLTTLRGAGEKKEKEKADGWQQ